MGSGIFEKPPGNWLLSRPVLISIRTRPSDIGSHLMVDCTSLSPRKLHPIPTFLTSGFKVQALPFIGDFLDMNLPGWFKDGLGLRFFFGGTSILIIVGVAMDTVQQIEAQLTMRNYDTFSGKGRIRGRR